MVTLEELIQLDQHIFVFLNSYFSDPRFDAFFLYITDINKRLPFQLLFIPFFLFMLYRKYKLKKTLLALCFIFLSLGATETIGTQVFKNNFQRLRPYQTENLKVIQRSSSGGYSFISNHAANAAALAVTVSLLVPSFTLGMIALALIVGFSRIYLGVHFPSDVFVGFLVGYLVARLFFQPFKRYIK